MWSNEEIFQLIETVQFILSCSGQNVQNTRKNLFDIPNGWDVIAKNVTNRSGELRRIEQF